MFIIVFYVPENSVDTVKDAMFEAGAGAIGNYDKCSWQVLGDGQFRPLKGSNPTLGKLDVTETVKEFRVEITCKEEFLENCIKALKKSHPYEEPAYHVYKNLI